MNLEQARSLFQEGNEHFEAGRLIEARRCFEVALELAPGRPSVLANLGVTLHRLGQWQESLPLLELANVADPSNADAWFARGLSHEALGHWQMAADALRKGLEIEPRNASLFCTRARCLLHENRIAEAMAVLDEGIAATPGSPEPWSEKGALLREMNQIEAAARCIEKAIALGADPELHAYYLASVSSEPAPSAPPPRYIQMLFDGYADDFQTHLVDQLKYQAHERLTKPLLAAGRHFGRALDLGCGTGLCGRLIQSIVDRIDGVDLSEKMLDQARRSGAYSALVCCDIAEFLEKDGESYDLILAADVLIYVGDLSRLFAAIRRRLDEHGVFAFSVETLQSSNGGFRLLPSLRYAHSERYVRDLALANGLFLAEMFSATLREDQRQPVAGMYCYLRHGRKG